MGRPAQAGRQGRSRRTRSPRAPRSGTCSPPTGQASDGGKDPQAGLAYVSELITEHVKVQDKSGREALQNFTSGNGDVLLSYEYEATTAQKKGEDVDYVCPDDTIKINIDIADDQGRAGRGAERSSTTCCPSRRQEQLRRLGLPPGQRGGPRRQQVEVPRPARPLHDRRPRRLGARSTTSSSTRRRARSRRSRRTRGCRPPSERYALPIAARGARRAGAAERGARRSASSTLWLSLIVLLPLAAVVARSLDGGLGAFWDAVTSAARRSPRCASRCSSRSSPRRSTPSSAR